MLVPFPTHERSRRVEYLSPNRKYFIQIMAFTDDGMYTSENISARTDEGAPTMSPLNVRAESLSEHSVRVRFNPIPLSHHNGPLQGYNVYYRNRDHHHDHEGTKKSISASERQVVIDGLQSMQEYEISMSAFNDMEGPRSDEIEVVPGCGGVINKTAAVISLYKTNWDTYHCKWRIYDNGVRNAVLLLSVQYLRFHSCGYEYAKVYSEDGIALHHKDCSTVRGEVHEVPFGSSDVVHSEVFIQNMESKIVTDLVILKGGLHSAQPTQVPWNIKGNEGSDFISLDWSGFPGNLGVNFFVISLNQTELSPYKKDDYHHDDKENKLVRFHKIVNSCETFINITDLPIAAKFIATVYIVNNNNEIYKSEKLMISTEEGVPLRFPHPHDWSTNLDSNTVSFQLSSIERRYRGGEILGYRIIYGPCCDPNNLQTMEVDAGTRRVTLENLTDSLTYAVHIGGYTSKGMGTIGSFGATFCGGDMEADTDQITSPNYPGTPYIGHDQWDENPKCYWNIAPKSSVSGIFLTVRNFLLGRRDEGNRCHGQLRMYFPGISENDENLATDLCGYIPENLTILVIDKVLNLRASGFGYQRYEEEYRDKTKFLIDYEAVKGDITTVTGEAIDSWTGLQMVVGYTYVTVSWPEPPSSFISSSSVDYYQVLVGGWSDRIYVPQNVAAEEKTLKYEWLFPLRNYTLKVITVLKDGRRGCTDWIKFRTTEGVPARNPFIETIEVIDYSTIGVRWHKIDTSYANGIIRGYRVHIIQANDHDCSQGFYDSVTVGPEEIEVTLTGLPAGTDFRVWVTAFTSIGEGHQKHERWVKTKCGAPLHDKKGLIRSREFPSRIKSGDCLWDIYPKNKSVLIHFEHFSLPESDECRDFYATVGDSSGVEPEQICGDREPFDVLVQAKKVLLLSHAEHEAQGDRTGFELHYMTLNHSVSEAELKSGWTITASNVASSTAEIAWSHYSPGAGETLVLYAIVCTPTSHAAGPSITTVKKEIDESNAERLRPYTNYTAKVIALVKNELGEMSLKGSEEVSITTREGVPSKPPEDVAASADDGIITVTWKHIPSDYIHGMLVGYRIYYRLYEGWVDDKELDLNQFSFIEVIDTALEASIVNLTNFETYEVMVAGFTAVGEGPFSERTHSRPGCQTSIRSDMRVISSPGYPDNYPNDVECYWIFEKEMPVFDVVVVIEDFHTEEPDGGANCTNWITDYIGLFNLAPLHVAAGPFCGLQSPFALTAKSYQHRRALLYFRTNNGFAFKGFTSTYFAITDSSKITVSLGAIKNVEVQMTWKSSSDGDKIKEYYILYKPVKEKEIWRFKKTVTLSATLVPLETLTEYDVRVVGYTNGREVYASKVTRFTTKESDDGGEPTKAPEPAPILRMYPYGIDAGDSVITFPSRTECFRIGREKFEIGGFPFFDRRHRKLHICPNGAIQFERDGLNEKAYNFGQRPWLRYFSIIAPYWAPTDLESFKSGPSKVFYHLYDARQAGSIAILENATSDVLGKFSGELPQGKTFNASWVLVVTWKDIRHKVLNDDTKTLHNTFQTLLITDGIFSFTMFNYPHNGIQYSAPTKREYYEYFSNYKQLPVIGWNAGDSDNNYVNYQRSGTVQAETIDNLVGNAKIPGRWIFRLENSNGEEDSDLKCEMWYFKERKALFFYRKEPDPCPCTGVQGYFDDRYEWVEADFPFSYCFYTKFPREGRGRKCCYYTTLDKLAALIIGFPGGGSLHRYHSLTASLKDQHEASDLDGFRYCCLQAKNPLMCRKYYELRPSKGCDGYEPPEWSWLWGDPHIVTLDGQNYTFNGLGEYTMVELQDASFQLQARTKLAKGGGTATVFVAAVAKEKDTSTVQVNLKDEGGLEVLVDSVVYQNYTSLTNISRTLDGSVSVARPENNSFLVAFPSGISVTITEVQGSLSIVFAAPTNLKGKTKGLLGTWNDDVEDDFLRPDNTTLPSNSTGREIHFEFGLKWQVTSDTSLFTYKPGENTSSFVNESFVPIFLDEPIPFASDELKQKAEAVCGGDANCLFDIASTGDVEVGASTKQVAVQLESESQELQNFPPKILVGPTELNITVNTTANVTIVAQDPNNDTITFSVTGTLPKGYTTSTTDSSLSFKWEVTTDKIDIQFIVADATTKTVLQPSINICACQNQGVCAPVEEEDADNSADSNENKFTILSCTCQNGYTGTFCDADLDACEENFQPCYPGVTCNDLPAPANKTGFKCDPCPNGYSGDGIECSDVDECNKNTDGCSDTCINTPGSFVCQCNAGYSLGIDKKTCTDIDECSPVGNCMHVCENTQGSYNCKCNADFKVDPDDSKKCIPMNPCEGNHGCQHVCYQSNGQDKCSCNAGYELNGDGKTCSDVDECSSSDNNRCSQTCKNTVGSYECSCVAGFKLDSDSYACNDIDECMEFTFSCDPSQKCENTPGSYKCVCDEGLYWIDNMCKGLEKGEAPPPPPPASTPRTPTDEEKSESVNVEAALDISLWNAEVEEKFKTTLAEAATTHCATNDDCKSKETGSRRRRAASYVTFTEDQVHLLPGYPKQISVVPLLASLAFYLQFPPGSSAPVIKKDVLAAIIQGSLSELSSSINANISSVQILYADTTTTTTGTTLMTTAIPTEKDRSKMHAIVGGCVAGAVILILVIIAIAWYCNRRKKNGVGKQRVDSERSISRQVSGMEMAAVNDAYMTSQDSFLPGSVEPQYAELKPQYEELKRPENEYTMLNSKR
ncbi:uncharacterized protein LOC111338572 [Stylophora pistillata]|uniref:uncharacterized protein LOC111338572 n=1 Tax=Stylophora pistillata TaxID=50429 RepID=UPI000C0571C5|nr:uncharacterized protein LOC111338572 [Stylophora pistillata]